MPSLSDRRPEWPGGEASAWNPAFPLSCHTSDWETDALTTTLSGAWCFGVKAGTGWPGVSIPLSGEISSLIGSFCLSVAARKIVWLDQSLRYTGRHVGGTLSSRQQQQCPSLSDRWPQWPGGEVWASRTADNGDRTLLFSTESYPWLKDWYSSHYPVWRLML